MNKFLLTIVTLGALTLSTFAQEGHKIHLSDLEIKGNATEVRVRHKLLNYTQKYSFNELGLCTDLSATYANGATANTMYNFDVEGNLLHRWEQAGDYEENYSVTMFDENSYEIVPLDSDANKNVFIYNAERQLIRKETYEDDDYLWLENDYEYDEQGQLTKSTLYEDDLMVITSTYSYTDGLLESVMQNNLDTGMISVYSYEYSDFDSQGNWLTRTSYLNYLGGEKPIVEESTRIITYADN